MNVYVFGNEYLAEDSLAASVSKHLDCHIVRCRSPEELMEADDDPITILDVAKGATEPSIIKLEQLKTRSLMSMHDFDLSFFLNLMKELGQEKHIRIIGIPQQGDPAQLAREVQALL